MRGMRLLRPEEEEGPLLPLAVLLVLARASG